MKALWRLFVWSLVPWIQKAATRPEANNPQGSSQTGNFRIFWLEAKTLCKQEIGISFIPGHPLIHPSILYLYSLNFEDRVGRSQCELTLDERQGRTGPQHIPGLTIFIMTSNHSHLQAIESAVYSSCKSLSNSTVCLVDGQVRTRGYI